MSTWHIITPEYPPWSGGVGEYSRLVANGLADHGGNIHVWTTGVEVGTASEKRESEGMVTLHGLPGKWGRDTLKALTAIFNAPSNELILLQCVVTSFGWANLPFCILIYTLSKHHPVWVMFHEVAMWPKRGLSLKTNLWGAMSVLMAKIIACSAERAFVSSPEYSTSVHRLAASLAQIKWLPIPSTIPELRSPENAKAVKRLYVSSSKEGLLGHFCGPLGRSEHWKMVTELLPALLNNRADRKLLLLGTGGGALRSDLIDSSPSLTSQIFAAGKLSSSDISYHLSACDLIVHPYPEGITTRRTSAMAALSHGLPLVTTQGELSEPLWAESGAVALARSGDTLAIIDLVNKLLADPEERTRIGQAAKNLYASTFALEHTIDELEKLSTIHKSSSV
jgi:glycosyltransferase involved in cell wall biosynthesis